MKSFAQTFKRKPAKQRGFTLIEVMVALVLLSISLGAVLASINQHSFQLSRSHDYFQAHRVAMHVAGQYKAAKAWPSLGTREDTIKVGGAQWSWKAITTKTPEKDVRRVVIEVYAPKAKDSASKVVIFQNRPL